MHRSIELKLINGISTPTQKSRRWNSDLLRIKIEIIILVKKKKKKNNSSFPVSIPGVNKTTMKSSKTVVQNRHYTHVLLFSYQSNIHNIGGVVM